MDKLIIISLILLFFLIKFYYTFSKDTFYNPIDNLSPSETKMLATEFSIPLISPSSLKYLKDLYQ